jgi:hypothetical protein
MLRSANYLSFDIMTDVIFSKRMHLLTRPDYRYIYVAMERLMDGVGVLSQIPIWKRLRLDYLFLRGSVKGEMIFRQEATKIAMGRLKQSSSSPDIYQKLIDATDPETELRLSIPELLANTALLIVAGKWEKSHVSSMESR